jgi:hypothetical protein
MNLNAVKLAAWLHDVIYESKASDNEERSAEYAERLCEELAIPEGQQVAALVRMTKTHDAGDDVDGQMLERARSDRCFVDKRGWPVKWAANLSSRGAETSFWIKAGKRVKWEASLSHESEDFAF